MNQEINGFEIDQYNQYGLKDGTRYSTCPLCSNGRRGSNKKAKCASLDWERGLGTCHHCGEVFQLHTYRKKTPLKPYYAYDEKPNGKITYYHDDGTTTER